MIAVAHVRREPAHLPFQCPRTGHRAGVRGAEIRLGQHHEPAVGKLVERQVDVHPRFGAAPSIGHGLLPTTGLQGGAAALLEQVQDRDDLAERNAAIDQPLARGPQVRDELLHVSGQEVGGHALEVLPVDVGELALRKSPRLAEVQHIEIVPSLDDL
jgi:hypothetical protein